MLYSGGFQLVTATSIATACSMIRILPICGVIMCDHSWTEAERGSIATELQKLHLPTMDCPGCTDCDETCGKPGKMKDLIPLTKLMTTLGRTPL